MPRHARIVVENVVHHAVARGVDGLILFRNAEDKVVYLKRAAKISKEEAVLVHGYSLMENHVHFLLTPTTSRGLGRFFSRLHTWWAMYFNKKTGRKGHLFQARYFSSTLSESHYLAALRYVERNAVRAKLVQRPEDWVWSSARAHLLLVKRSIIPLSPVQIRTRLKPGAEWREFLQSDQPKEDEEIRRAHRGSHPCGPKEFVEDIKRRFRQVRTPVTSALAN